MTENIVFQDDQKEKIKFYVIFLVFGIVGMTYAILQVVDIPEGYRLNYIWYIYFVVALLNLLFGLTGTISSAVYKVTVKENLLEVRNLFSKRVLTLKEGLICTREMSEKSGIFKFKVDGKKVRVYTKKPKEFTEILAQFGI